MEVSDQIHGLDMSSPQAEPPVPTPEPVWTIRRREKSLTPELFLSCPTHSLVTMSYLTFSINIIWETT
jgi:hypothetical protein